MSLQNFNASGLLVSFQNFNASGLVLLVEQDLRAFRTLMLVAYW